MLLTKNTFSVSVAVCALGVFYAGSAHADYLKVYSPHIEKGELAIEADINHDTDHRNTHDGYLSQVYGVEYGVNDYWMTELGGEIEKDPDGSAKLTNLKWENILAPFKPGEMAVDSALYLEIEKAAIDGEPNHIEAKALLEKDSGNFKNLANLGISKEWGGHSTDAVGGSLALRSAYKLDPRFEPGIEYYADLGNLRDRQGFNQQNHQIGPVIQGKIGHVKYDSGLLFGVSSEAPDTTAKINLEYEF